MTQRYGTVHSRFWISAKEKGWDDATALAALYLLTGPHCTIAGAMRLPLAYMAEDLSWPVEKCRDTLAILYRDGFLTRCERSDWTVINKRLLYDRPMGSKQLVGVLRVLADMPADHPAWPEIMPLLQELGRQSKVDPLAHLPLLRPASGGAKDTPSIGYPNPMPHPIPQPHTFKSPPDGGDLKALVFDRGVSLLTGQGVREDAARSYLGKAIGAYSVGEVFEAIAQAEREGAVDVKSFIAGALRAKRPPNPKPGGGNGGGPDDYAKSQMRKRADARTREEGLNPLDKAGMERSAAIYRELLGHVTH